MSGWLKALDLDQHESAMVANGFDDIKFLVGLLPLKTCFICFLCSFLF